MMNPFDMPQKVSARCSSRYLKFNFTFCLLYFLMLLFNQYIVLHFAINRNLDIDFLVLYLVHSNQVDSLNRYEPFHFSELNLSNFVKRAWSVVQKHVTHYKETRLTHTVRILLDNKAMVLVAVWGFNVQSTLEEALPFLWQKLFKEMRADKELLILSAFDS